MGINEDILSVKPGVSNKVSKFTKFYENKWWNASTELPHINKKTSYIYKWKKEIETNKFIDNIVKAIEKYPKEDEQHKIWENEITDLVNEYINNSDLITMQDKEILLNRGLVEVTEDFVNEAKNFNSKIDIEDLGQAIRNVWIANIIQMLFDKKPELTPSLFGYSMLYPYTDNYLDDTSITKEDKMKISLTFGKRITGEISEPNNKYEKDLFDLFSKIEMEYNREKYPEVYEILVCMHNAQIKSLMQQGKASGPYEADILGISFEKGGISVLADAYLVNGTLNEYEAAFLFGYGVLLQICDDLQDAEADFRNNNMTIISQLAYKWPLDVITNKLINFTFDLFDDFDFLNCKNKNALIELICRNCINLILFAVAKNKGLYSSKYFKQLEQYFPFRTKYMTGILRRLKKKYSSLNEYYNGVKTDKIIEEILLSYCNKFMQ